MYSLSTVIVFAVITLGIGIVVGALASRRIGGQTQLQQRLEEAEQQFKDYQADVTEHFEETSRRVNNLTRSYRDVHEYLASSAMKLTNPQVSRAITQAARQNLPGSQSLSEEENFIDSNDTETFNENLFATKKEFQSEPSNREEAKNEELEKENA